MVNTVIQGVKGFLQKMRPGSAIQLIEKIILSKTGKQETCEDGMVITDDFVAVIDGASLSKEKRPDGRTNGQIAKDILIQVVQQMKFDITMEQFIELATNAIYQYYIDNNIDELTKHQPKHRAIACCAVYSHYRKEIWVLGDCQARIDGTLHTNPIPVDDVTIAARVMFIEAELAAGKTKEEIMLNDTGRQYVQPLIERQGLFQNSNHPKLGYAVLDGYAPAINHVRKISVRNAKEIILATDGPIFLENSIEESLKEMENLQKIDPLCIGGYRECYQVHGFKEGNILPDDIAIIKFQIK